MRVVKAVPVVLILLAVLAGCDTRATPENWRSEKSEVRLTDEARQEEATLEARRNPTPEAPLPNLKFGVFPGILEKVSEGFESCRANAILFGGYGKGADMFVGLTEEMFRQLDGSIYVNVVGYVEKCTIGPKDDPERAVVRAVRIDPMVSSCPSTGSCFQNKLVKFNWRGKELSEGKRDVLVGVLKANPNHWLRRDCEADAVLTNPEDGRMSVPVFGIPEESGELAFVNGTWTAQVPRDCPGWAFRAHPIYSLGQ